MRVKPPFEVRVKEAKKQLERVPVSIERIAEIIGTCLKEKGIEGFIEVKSPPIDFKQIAEVYKTNDEGHLIWISFLKSGHVAVVGAGKDIRFQKNNRTGTCLIMKRLKDDGIDVDWNEEKVIIIPIKELNANSNGIKNVKKSVLECRNGVEHYIGESLLNKNVPILNLHSHKNYSDKYWEKCAKNNYLLK